MTEREQPGDVPRPAPTVGGPDTGRGTGAGRAGPPQAVGPVDAPTVTVTVPGPRRPPSIPDAQTPTVRFPVQRPAQVAVVRPAPPGPRDVAPGNRFPAGPVGPGHGTAPAPAAAWGAPAPTWGAPGYGPPPAAGHAVPGAYPDGPTAFPPPTGAAPNPSTRRRTVRILVALVAVLALAAGGVGTYLLLRSPGGATPAEATRLLADDLESADLPGAVSRVHPAEVALGGDLGSMLRDELVRLEILRPDVASDATLTGVTFANLQFDDAAVEQVRPNVAITKLVGGMVTIDRNADATLLTDSFKRLAYPGGTPPARAPKVVDIAEVVARQGHPVRVATVQVDGHWFVSVAYTLADNALLAKGEAWPQGTVAPRGAATPQDALRDGVAALLAQDARRLVELAPPTELAVVHDLGPLLVERAGTPRPGGRLVDLATTQTAVPGGTALTVDRMVAEDDTGARATVVRDGDCLAVTPVGGYPRRVCAADLADQRFGALPRATDPAVRDITVRVARAALAMRVVVVEEGGQYYVSPARTLAGLGVDVLHTLQPADLVRLMTVTT